MNDYIIRSLAWACLPTGEPTYSEMSTRVEIVDEGADEYVEVSQCGRPDLGKIAITREEWPTLRAAIDYAVHLCKESK